MAMVMTRSDFQAALVAGFDGQIFGSLTPLFKIFLTNDKISGDSYRLNMLRANALITAYLAAWDAAPTDPDKEAIEASVTFDLGSASFNPDDAVLWPQSGGLFGDIKSPGTIIDGSPALFDGTSGQMLKQGTVSQINQIIASAPVNGKTVGNTSIFTTDASKTFVPTGVFVTVLNVTGLALVSTISVGTNSPNYNNISPATILTGLSTVNDILNLALSGTVNAVAPGTQVFARVSIGSTATVYDLNAAIIGFYL